MITALAFVPKGKARQAPLQDEPSDTELQELKAAVQPADLAVTEEERAAADGSSEEDMQHDGSAEDGIDGREEDDAEAAVEHARAVAASMHAAPAEGWAAGGAGLSKVEAAFAALDMDKYDAESDDDNLMGRLLQDTKIEHIGKDEFVTEQGAAEDKQEATLQATDLLVLAAKTEEDAAALEVWVVAEGEAEDGSGAAEVQAYVHHDIMLSAFPLSVAWSDFNPAQPKTAGNFAAVSTFEPEIEIWDLDVLDVLKPALVLGGRKGKRKKKASKRGGSKASTEKFKPGSHTDSVLCLAWNAHFRNGLASGSADHTIKAWDLATGRCEHTLISHRDKVQALAWHPTEASCLLSGGFDKQALVSDLRTPNGATAAWQCPEDVESLAWNPHQPATFVVSSEKGEVACYDTRKGAGAESVFTLAAHAKATTGMAFNPAAAGLLVTGSVDRTVKLWDISDASPKALASQDLGIGAVFTLGVPADAAHLVVAGGAQGEVSVWDLRHHKQVAAALA